MSTTTHTPGPWAIANAGELNPSPCGIRSVSHPTGMICHLPSEHESLEANAALIASAPELLEALQTAQMALFGVVTRNSVVQAALDTARAAIAKATTTNA
jgi:hypothetical protein